MMRRLFTVTLCLLVIGCGDDGPTTDPSDVVVEPEGDGSQCEQTHVCSPPSGCSNAAFSNQNLCEENGGAWIALATEAACDEAGYDWVAITTEAECIEAGYGWLDPNTPSVNSWADDADATDEPETTETTTETTTGPTEQDTVVEPTEPDASPEGDAQEPEEDAGPIEDDVELPNVAPVAVDDHAAVFAGEVLHIEVRANDSDPNGDPLSIVAVSDGAFGTVAVTDGGIKVGERLTYTPSDATSLGIDTFTYTISDPDGLEATATVTVNQVEATDTPMLTILSPEHGAVIEDHTVTIAFEAPGCYFTSPSVEEAGCHGHKWLDGEKWASAEGGAVGHYSTANFELGPLTDGIHTFEFILHRNDGTDDAWDPEVTVEVSFEIQGGFVAPLEPIEPVATTQQVLSMQPAAQDGDLLLGTPAGLYQTQGQDLVVGVFFGPRITALARDPFSIATYYASGQWPESGMELWGLAKSVNGGQSWTELGLTNEAMFEDLAIATDQPDVLAGVWASQVHVSEDGGETWSPTPLTSWVDDLIFQSTDPMVLLLAGPDGLQSMDIATGESTNVSEQAVTALDRVGQQIGYVTTDGVIHLCDAALTECTTGPTPSTDTVIQLASEMTNPELLYLLTTASQVFRSPDGGANWELFVDGNP
jgi:hypothetical protein